MTNTTTTDRVLNDRNHEEATVNITSLEQSGAEPWTPKDELAELTDPTKVVIAGQESTTHAITFDHLDKQFNVRDRSDNSLTSSGTDVGEVEVVAFGNR